MTINKVSRALKNISLKEKEADILAYVMSNNRLGTDQRSIERNLDLRQPEVSATLKKLIDKKWVRIAETIRSGKRPINVYKLAKSPAEIAEELSLDRYNETRMFERSLIILEQVSSNGG